MNAVVELVNKVSSKFGFLTAEEERDLIAKAKKGDSKAKDNLFGSNARFLLKEATRYANTYNLPLEDMFSACCEGFAKAIDKFDLNTANRLITPTGWWMRSCVQEEVYRNHAVHIPHNKIALLKDLKSDNLDTEDRLALYNAVGKTVSLDTPFDCSDDEDATMGDFIKSDIPDPSEDCMKIYARREIETIMDEELSPKEVTVLRMAYGFEDGERKTLGEIGEKIGCTKQRADQIKKEALKKLRHPRVAVKLRDFVA